MLFLFGSLAVVFLLCSAFFSASETALFSIPRERIPHFAHTGKRSDFCINALLTDGQRTLLLILLGNLFVNVSLVGFVHVVIDQVLGHQSPVLTLVVATSVLLLFGEMLPKSIALRNNEMIAARAAPVLYVLAIALRPVIDVARATNMYLLRKFGKRLQDPSPFITVDELATAVNAYARDGAMSDLERKIILAMLDLGGRPVKMVMTHRARLVLVGHECSCGDALAAMLARGSSLCLVSQPGPSHEIAGIAYGLELRSLAPDSSALRACESPLWVHSSMESGDCFALMLAKGKEHVCVVDEFGSLCGLVCLSEIADAVLREAFGTGATPDDAESPVRVCKGGDEIADLKGWIPPSLAELSEGVRTLNGLITSQLGQIPRAGYKFALDGFDFYIIDASQTVVKTVLIRKPGAHKA